MKETGEITILLYYTENVTLKQILNRACRTAQRLASSVRELTEAVQILPFKRKGTSRVYELPTGQHSGKVLLGRRNTT